MSYVHSPNLNVQLRRCLLGESNAYVGNEWCEHSRVSSRRHMCGLSPFQGLPRAQSLSWRCTLPLRPTQTRISAHFAIVDFGLRSRPDAAGRRRGVKSCSHRRSAARRRNQRTTPADDLFSGSRRSHWYPSYDLEQYLASGKFVSEIGRF